MKLSSRSEMRSLHISKAIDNQCEGTKSYLGQGKLVMNQTLSLFQWCYIIVNSEMILAVMVMIADGSHRAR